MSDSLVGLSDQIRISEDDKLRTILSVLDALPELAFLLTRSGQYLEVFGSPENLLVADAKYLIGKKIHEVMPKENADSIVRFIEKVLDSNESQSIEYELEVKDGRRLFQGTVTPLNLKYEEGLVVWFARDITDQRRKEQSMEFLAYHDSLTGLLNRELFLERLDEEYSRCTRHNSYSTLVFIDLDNFRELNKEHGRELSNDVLQQVASRLENQTREHDLIARYGEDEFVLVFSMIGDSIADAIDHSADVATKIKQTVNVPILIDRKVI